MAPGAEAASGPRVRPVGRARLALVAGVTTLWESFEADMKLAFALSALCATVVALLWFVASERTGRDGVAQPSNAIESAPALLDEPVDAALAAERSTPARASLESARVELVRLQVHVVTRGSRAPVSNHRVAAFRSGAPFEWSERPLSNAEALPGEIASTDANGDATLFVEPGQAHVIASVDDWAPRSRVEIAALAAGDSRTLELEVREPPDRVVHGLVLEVGTGAPVHGASVSFTENGPEIARSDERGAFVVTGRSRERKQFVVSRDDWLATYAPLEAGHERADLRLVVLMARRTHVDVRVVDKSGVAIEAAVRANFDREKLTRGAPFLSDDVWYGVARSGAPVRLSNIPAQVELTISAVGSLGAQASQSVVLPATSHATELTLVLEDGDTIVGTVSGLRRRSGVEVHLWRPSEFARAGARVFGGSDPLDVTVLTDANGSFRFAGLGTGLARVSCADSTTGLVASALELQLVGDGRTYEVALVAAPAARIRGRIRDADGAPRAGHVSARRTGELEAAFTDADNTGNFEFDMLAPGDYEVSVLERASSAFTTVHALPGDNSVELRLAPSKYLKLRLVDKTGAAVRGRAQVVSEVGLTLTSYESDRTGVVMLLCPATVRPVRVSAHSVDGKLAGEREFVPRDASELDLFLERFELSPALDGEAADGEERRK